jgi:hypothetical protein
MVAVGGSTLPSFFDFGAKGHPRNPSSILRVSSLDLRVDPKPIRLFLVFGFGKNKDGHRC